MMKNPEPARLQEPIGVLGYGVEGTSTCKYLLSKGYKDITVFDRQRPINSEPGLSFAEGYLTKVPEMRTLFRSAGIRPDLTEISEFLRRGGTLTSQIELAFAIAGNHRIIGVTGTLGKGTCCSILSAMLDTAGIKSALGGNIGIPALDLAVDLAVDEKLILELSSFQLATLKTSPSMAAVLKTTSEHLDWHLSQNEYWLHKANLVASQTEEDFLTYYQDVPGSRWIAEKSRARKIGFGGQGRFGQANQVQIAEGKITWPTQGFSLPLSATQLKGEFNLENLAAAGTLALELGAKPEEIVAAAANFVGLEHRLEFVRQIGEIAYYNDSYATRPDASIGAISALAHAPLGLILGGSDKLADFSELARAIAGAYHLKAISLIGQTADRLEQELRTTGLVNSERFKIAKAQSLEDAVEFLLANLPKGSILLSPACASFGMFENYKERGKAFKRLVAGL
jgi:UDP-N-acetylmuramoylalanine--D-glutamate ligase